MSGTLCDAFFGRWCMNNVTGASSSALSAAPAPDGGVALGLGLTNECNLKCAFCYRDPTRADRLSLEQVKSVMERLPVRSVNLGTGENGMHPDFKAILTYLRTRPVNLTITSNGHSVAVLEDNELRAFHDIEFSLDYPTQAEQDEQRGPGNWELIHQQAERCVRLGVPVTIIAVMMKSNYLRLADVARVAKQFNAPLRVNVYQAVRSDLYALTYEEYWQGFRKLFESIDMKLRGSWGQVGIDGNLGNGTEYATIASGYLYNFGHVVYPGMAANRVPNSNLKWETVSQSDVGLDVGLLDNRITFTTDYFSKRYGDMITQRLIP